ncbi:MAG: D-aminoacyl-tRNA deacylase [Candidatus Kariarchaeaceae archaeon]
MKIGILTSVKDLASSAAKKRLIEQHSFKETTDYFDAFPIYQSSEFPEVIIVTSQSELVDSDHFNQLELDFGLIASRHASASGKPALLVHSTGLWGNDESYGGKAHQLSLSSAALQGHTLRVLAQVAKDNLLEEIDLSLEVTHHGPLLVNWPSVFIEIGSSEEEWVNHSKVKVLEETIWQMVIDLQDPSWLDEGISYIGFGGNHYASKFSKKVLEGWNVGHIIPKYFLAELTEDQMIQAIDQTLGQEKVVLVDRKGSKLPQREMIKSVCAKLGLDYIQLG